MANFERKYKSESKKLKFDKNKNEWIEKDTIRYINKEYKEHGKGKNDTYFKFVNKNYNIDYNEWKKMRNFISKTFRKVEGLDNYSALTYLMIKEEDNNSLKGLKEEYKKFENFTGKRFNYEKSRYIFTYNRTETFRKMYGDFKVSDEYEKTLNEYFEMFKNGEISMQEFSKIMNDFKDYNKNIIDSRQQYDLSMYFEDIE